MHVGVGSERCLGAGPAHLLALSGFDLLGGAGHVCPGPGLHTALAPPPLSDLTSYLSLCHLWHPEQVGSLPSPWKNKAEFRVSVLHSYCCR